MPGLGPRVSPIIRVYSIKITLIAHNPVGLGDRMYENFNMEMALKLSICPSRFISAL